MGEKNKPKGRNKIFKQLRTSNTIEEITDRRGKMVCLNLAKRILLDRPYVNLEYEAERVRMMKKIKSKMENKE